MIIQFPVNHMKKEMQGLNAETKSTRTNFEDLHRTLQSLQTGSMSGLSHSLSGMQGLFSSLGVELGEMPNRFLDVGTAATRLLGSLDTLGKTTLGKQLTSATEQFSRNIFKKTTSTADAVGNNMNTMSENVGNNMNTMSENVGNNMNTMSQRNKNFGKSIKHNNVALREGDSALQGLGARLVASTKQTKDADAANVIATNHVNALSDAHQENTGILGNSAQQISIFDKEQKKMVKSTKLAKTKLTLKTGVMKGLNFAKKGFKALWKLSPMGMIAGVATLAVNGIKLLADWLGNSNEETEKAIEGSRSLTDRMNESREAHRKRSEEVQREVLANRDLVTELRALQSQEELTHEQRFRSVEIARQLNDSIEGLNLTYNKATGILDDNGQAVFRTIDYYVELDNKIQTLEKNQDRLNEITQEYADIDLKLEELKVQLAGTNREFYEHIGGMTQVNRTYVELQDEIAGLMDQQEGLRNETKQLENQSASTSVNMSKLWEDLSWHHAKSFETMTDSQRAVVDGIREMVGISSRYLGDLTREFDYNNDLTWEGVQANQERMIQATDEHSRLYSELVAAGVSEAYLRAIGADSVQALPLLREMQEGGLDIVKKREGEWYAAHKNNLNTHVSALDGIGPKHRGAIKQYIAKDIGGTFQRELAASGFLEMGKEPPNGFMAGMEARRGAMEKSGFNVLLGVLEGMGVAVPDLLKFMSDTGTNIHQEFQKSLDERSPSRVFMDSGQNIIEGLFKGIDRHQERPTDLLQRIAQAMKRVYNNVNREYTTIGRNMMTGLNQGLLNGEGQVMSTAQRIANNVARTMREALDINSPSRVMREEIGRQIPAGVAAGIDKYADVALDSAYDLGQDLINVKLNLPSVEAMIGMGSSRHLAGTTNNANTYDNKVINHNAGLFEGATINWHGEEDIRRTMEKIAWATEREKARMW